MRIHASQKLWRQNFEDQRKEAARRNRQGYLGKREKKMGGRKQSQSRRERRKTRRQSKNEKVLFFFYACFGFSEQTKFMRREEKIRAQRENTIGGQKCCSTHRCDAFFC